MPPEQIPLLVLTRYGPLGSSSRLRMLQYLPRLTEAGFAPRVCPLFSDDYLHALYGQGRRPGLLVVPAYLRRLRQLLSVRRFAVLWVEKELFPFLPGTFEGLLGRTGVPYVLDYDDATFHRYDRHRSALVRRLLGRKLAPLIRGARTVTPGNAYLADYCRDAGAGDVRIVPTVVELDRYADVSEPETNEFRVGWIGSPTTTPFLAIAGAALEQLARERPVRLVVIGAGHLPPMDVPMERHDWSEQTEASLLAGVHIGIMPLPSAPWERGKCGYKLIQYMACGRAVIASPVGVNTDIVTDDVGLLAVDAVTWLDAVRRLADDAALRRAMGRAGRKRVLRDYSMDRTAPEIASILREAADAAPSRAGS